MVTNAEDSPPELFDTVESDYLFDIVHPTRGARGRWRDRRGTGCGGKVTTLGCRGIEPERPGRVEWVLEVMSADGDLRRLRSSLSRQARRSFWKGGPPRRGRNAGE